MFFKPISSAYMTSSKDAKKPSQKNSFFGLISEIIKYYLKYNFKHADDMEVSASNKTKSFVGSFTSFSLLKKILSLDCYIKNT